MNEKIINWFESGKIKEAFLGQGDFFIPNPTYRDDHDRLLIVHALFDWASIKGFNEVSNIFNNFLTDLIKDSVIDAIYILHSFVIVNFEQRQKIMLDYCTIELLLKNFIKNNQKLIANDKGISMRIYNIAEYLPGIR